MSIFNCKLCGSKIDVAVGAEIAVCPECKKVNTVPDCDDEIAALFNRAVAYWREQNFDQADKTYQNILSKDDTLAEAHWGRVFCEYGVIFDTSGENAQVTPRITKKGVRAVLASYNYNTAMKYASADVKIFYKDFAEKLSELQRQFRLPSEVSNEFGEIDIERKVDESETVREDEPVSAEEAAIEENASDSEVTEHHHHHHHHHRHHSSSGNHSSQSSASMLGKSKPNTRSRHAVDRDESGLDLKALHNNTEDKIKKFETIDSHKVSVNDTEVRNHIHETPDVYNINGTTKLVEKKAKKRNRNFIIFIFLITVPLLLVALLYWMIKAA